MIEDYNIGNERQKIANSFNKNYAGRVSNLAKNIKLLVVTV